MGFAANGSKAHTNTNTHCFYRITKKDKKSMLDLLGQQLGNYRLTRVLGQGGYAAVYLG